MRNVEGFAQEELTEDGRLDAIDLHAKLEKMVEKLELHEEGRSIEGQVGEILKGQLLLYDDDEDVQTHHQE